MTPPSPPPSTKRPGYLAPVVVLAILGLLLWIPTAFQRGPERPHPNLPHRPEHPNLIMMVVETLRADRLAAYGAARHTMPVVEGLAQRGILFERAWSAAPWTLPSVSSLLTGVTPGVHLVTEYEDVLGDRLHTLPERLRENGYETAFFGVNSLFESNRNIEQGFDHYFGTDEIPGTQLYDELSRWLQRRQDTRPLFLYIHFFEPHCAYQPPPELMDLYLPPLPSLRTGRTMGEQQWRNMHECFQLSTQQGEPMLDVDTYLARYDAEIRYVDHLVGLVLERLHTFGLFENSLITVTGDHGEAFWEHEDFGHGRQLYEESLHVPLILIPPGGLSGGLRHEEPVSLVDLTPTFLAAAGLPPDNDLQGLDLHPLWEGGRLPPRIIFAETDYDSRHVRAATDGRLKVITRVGYPPVELYDLHLDPKELTNLARNREQAAPLLHALEVHLQQSEELRPSGAPTREEMPAATLEKLRALGYTF